MSASLFALQSTIVLMVISRTNGLDDAGVFSIAYAVGSLMYYIGEYGVRKYQVSDVNEELSFTDYHAHRVAACIIMIAASIGYITYNYYSGNYSGYKAYIVIMVCLIKVVEAYSEVYFGRYQQVGRLDVSAKTNFYRTAVGVIAFIIALAVTRDMALSMTVWLVAVIAAFATSSLAVMKEYAELKAEVRWDKILKIFIDCLPLFIGYFMINYVSNAPKYAIDACMSDTDQACYNFIFQPVFAIGLFANFIFNPILVDLAHRWDGHRIKDFSLIVIRQVFVIFAITILAIAVALTIGCPILGMLFNADITEYKTDLAILMVGGGMLALVNFFAVVVTVMRRQNHLAVGYIAVAIAAGLAANHVVALKGIRGATLLYTCLMSLLSIVFALIMIIFIRKGKDSK